MSTEQPSVRRSQVVTTYGPGALVAQGDDSFMVLGLDRWPQPDSADFIPEPRLCAQLQVKRLRQPPTAPEEQTWRSRATSIPIVRFPRIHSCSHCKRLDFYWKIGDENNDCSTCGRSLTPSRFVVACNHGHIDDFPYSRWVHRGGTSQDAKHVLSIHSTGESSSLRSIEVRCTCGEQRTLDGAFDRRELRNVTRCTGRSPWLSGLAAATGCDGEVRTAQRGASNVWFSTVRSALSIPPWSDRAALIVNDNWDLLSLAASDPAMLRTYVGQLAYQLPTSPDATSELFRAAEARSKEDGRFGTPPSDLELRAQEYSALLDGHAETGTGDEFVAESVPAPLGIADHFQRVVRASRLREVRALQSFSRLAAASSPEEAAPLAHPPTDWLPAIEVRGEGVFLELSPSRLAEWESDPDVKRRVSSIVDRLPPLRTDDEKHRGTPRFILVHTLAHAIIEQLSLDAGYPTAALRERLYVSDAMAGLLIYTATSDSAGSLGGLIEQAGDSRLEGLVRGAISRAAWCSADPVCIETEVSGVDGLNKAACHACALLPETSCEERNVLLDRGLLVGTPSNPSLGYFSEEQ